MQQKLTILGIETSCDETAASVVRLNENGSAEILSNVVHSQMEHQKYGGVVPEIAARAHIEAVDDIISKSLKEAGYSTPEMIKSLDAIAATTGPGLVGGVLVGMMSGKAMATAYDVPFVSVNHLEGHALSVRLTEECAFPYLLLLVSGGHCQLIWVESVGKYKRLGTTIDDAVGEAFDKTAKLIGLQQPGGPHIERMAKSGDPAKYDLPRPLLSRAGCDFSFSGLKTAIRQFALNAEPLTEENQADLAASFQATASAHLGARTKRALEVLTQEGHEHIRLVVSGGVAANQFIRGELIELMADYGTAIMPPPKLCTDNGAMIAWAAIEHIRAKGKISTDINCAARPRWPLDDNPNGDRHGGGKKGPKA